MLDLFQLRVAWVLHEGASSVKLVTRSTLNFNIFTVSLIVLTETFVAHAFNGRQFHTLILRITRIHRINNISHFINFSNLVAHFVKLNKVVVFGLEFAGCLNHHRLVF